MKKKRKKRKRDRGRERERERGIALQTKLDDIEILREGRMIFERISGERRLRNGRKRKEGRKEAALESKN